MKQIHLMPGIAFAFLLLCAPAQAQSLDRSIDEVLDIVSGENGQRNGHEKCKGNGHTRDDGHGHEEGECDEDGGETPAEPGPAEQFVCAVEVDAESSWSRFTCGATAYNEAYAAELVADNQTYPTELIDYVSTLDAEAVTAQLDTLDERLVAGGGELAAGVAEAVPLIGGPTPGPIVDEALESLNTYAVAYTGSAADRLVAGTDILLAGVAEAVPLIGGPTPGPIVDELLPYALATPERITAGVTVLGDAAARAVPLIGGPTPGPIVDEALVAATTYATTYVANTDERLEAGAGAVTDAVTRTVPLIGGPTPGPIVDEYRVGYIAGR